MSLTVILGTDSMRASRTVINDNFADLEARLVPGLYGSAVIDPGVVTAGDYIDFTFTLTGAVAGRPVSPGWPTALEAGLFGMMWVSATNTIKIRLLNLTGADINPASQTFSARVL